MHCIAFSPLGHSDPGVISNDVLKEVAQELGRTSAQVRLQPHVPFATLLYIAVTAMHVTGRWLISFLFALLTGCVCSNKHSLLCITEVLPSDGTSQDVALPSIQSCIHGTYTMRIYTILALCMLCSVQSECHTFYMHVVCWLSCLNNKQILCAPIVMASNSTP